MHLLLSRIEKLLVVTIVLSMATIAIIVAGIAALFEQHQIIEKTITAVSNIV